MGDSTEKNSRDIGVYELGHEDYMNKVLIISDSHGDMNNIKKIAAAEKKLDMVIHLGDIIRQDDLLREIFVCPVEIVKGNCDFSSDNPQSKVIYLGEKRAFITHGHMYGVDYSLETLGQTALYNDCQVAMYGHTHEPSIDYRYGLTFVNPGSTSRPRQLHRRKPTYCLCTVKNNGDLRFDIKYVPEK